MSERKSENLAVEAAIGSEQQIVVFPERKLTLETGDLNTTNTAEDAQGVQEKRGRLLFRIALGTTLPVATGIDLIQALPGRDVDINGITMSVKPSLQNYSHVGLGLAGDYKNPAHKSEQGIDLGAEAKVESAHGLQLEQPLIQAGVVQMIKHPQAAAQRLATGAQHDAYLNGGSGAAGALVLAATGVAVATKYRKAFADSANLTESQQRFIKNLGRAGKTFVAGTLLAAYSYAGHTVMNSHNENVPVDGQLSGPLSNLLTVLNPGSDDRFVATVEKNTADFLTNHPELIPTGPGWLKPITIIDDPQDVASMTSEAGIIANDTKSSAVVVLGDLATFEDSGVGLLTADALAEKAHKKDLVLIDGDHETPKGNRYAEADGFTVSDNKVHMVGGLKTLEVSSVFKTTINSGQSGSELRNPAINLEASITTMVDTIHTEQPEIVLAHDHKYLAMLATAYIQKYCPPEANGTASREPCELPLFFGGRSFEGPIVQHASVPGYGGIATIFTAGSGGGHRNTSVQFELRNPSNQNVLFYNSQTGAVQVLSFTINQDGTVKAKTIVLRKASIMQNASDQAVGGSGPVSIVTTTPK